MKKLLCTLLLSGCANYHKPQQDYYPTVQTKEQFSQMVLGDIANPWYHNWDDPDLSELIEAAFSGNLGLQSAWRRLNIAKIQARQAGSGLYPTVSGNIGANVQDSNQTPRIDGDSIGLSANWEWDIWKKIEYGQLASEANAKSREYARHYTAVLLANTITKHYVDLQYYQDLRQLTYDQISTSQDVLELTALRKAVGEGSIVDVGQQKLNVLSRESSLVDIEKSIKIIQLQLAGLTGLSPIGYDFLPTRSLMSELPPLPSLGTPEHLIGNHVQLQSEYKNLRQLDYNIGVAIANRLPSFSLSGGLNLTSPEFGFSLERTAFNLAASIVAVIFDNGRLNDNITIAREQLQAQILDFTQTYLDVIRDIELALNAEKQDRLKWIDTMTQIEVAQQNLEESQISFATGGVNYLSVLNSLSALQNLQRQALNWKRLMIRDRADLHGALGRKILD